MNSSKEETLEGKNVHSVYTLCYECSTWGINLPGNKQCGNCNSMDTMTYYDIETLEALLASQKQTILDQIEEWVRKNELKEVISYHDDGSEEISNNGTINLYDLLSYIKTMKKGDVCA